MSRLPGLLAALLHLCHAPALIHPWRRSPGWEKASYGYHGDDGNAFSCSGTGTKYGPTFGTDDVIGCCINFVDMTCFFTKNGTYLGERLTGLPMTVPCTPSLLLLLTPPLALHTKPPHLVQGIAFRNIGKRDSPKETRLYPCVGLRTPGEEVEANFGQKPFVFDIESHYAEMASRAMRLVQGVSLNNWQTTLDEVCCRLLECHPSPWSSQDSHLCSSPPPQRSLRLQLVTSYLVHYGYHETAQLLARDSKKMSESADSIAQRKSIRAHVLEGRIDEAIAATEAHFPSVLSSHPVIHFHLNCRKFVEMVAANSGREEEGRGEGGGVGVLSSVWV